jgi:hypothetical protein
MDKKVRRLRKMLRRTPTAYIDLIQWLKDRDYAQTTGEATRLILAEKVRVDSHAVGFFKIDGEKFLSVRIPAEHRGNITVLP